MGLPGIVMLITFVVLPLLLGAFWSLTNKRLISPVPTQFVGFENYRNLLSIKTLQVEQDNPEKIREILRNDSEYRGYRELFRMKGPHGTRLVLASDVVFLKSLRNTIIFVLFIVPGQGGAALILALLVNRKIRGRNFYRATYFAPVVTSMAVIAIVWSFLYNPSQGVINVLLKKMTFGKVSDIGWLVDVRYALPAIIIVSAWQATGFQMVIFLAGLQNIPVHLYEQAGIDGAGEFQRFRYITFPQLRNTTIFVVISTTILAFRVFTQIDVMTHGGPENSTSSVVYYAVEQGFRQQRIGYGSAITMIFFVFVLGVALLQNFLLKSEKAID